MFLKTVKFWNPYFLENREIGKIILYNKDTEIIIKQGWVEDIDKYPRRIEPTAFGAGITIRATAEKGKKENESFLLRKPKIEFMGKKTYTLYIPVEIIQCREIVEPNGTHNDTYNLIRYKIKDGNEYTVKQFVKTEDSDLGKEIIGIKDYLKEKENYDHSKYDWQTDRVLELILKHYDIKKKEVKD